MAESTTLFQETLELLDSTEESTASIAKGSDVSFYWLRKFRSREFVDPSVNKVQRVWEYLAKKPLLST